MFTTNRLIVSGCLVLALCAGCSGGGGDDTTPPSVVVLPPPPPPVVVPPPTLLNSCPTLPASSAPAGTLAAIVDASVATEMRAAGLPGMTVAIAKNGTILYAQGYGYANLRSCAPTQVNTEYQIGSVTKQFTAAAILQLQNAGRLNIDNTVVSYLPSYAFDPRITLRMLLNQASGLADYLGLPAAQSWTTGVAPQTVLTAITQAPLAFTPGSAYSYSNSNYFILGSVIEAVSAQSYASYMTANIFQPLGLTHTGYLQPLTSAAPYTYTKPAVPGTTGLADGIIPNPSFPFAAGALWSSVQDLATWNAALRNGNVIPAALFTLMVTPPSVPIHQQPGSSSPYAMGWARTTISGRTVVSHDGQTFAYTSLNGMFLDNGFTISVLTNVDIQGNTGNLGDFAIGLVQTICTTPATASSC